MLKAASEANQQEIFNYVIKTNRSCPVQFKICNRKMPAELKAEAMKIVFDSLVYENKNSKRSN